MTISTAIQTNPIDINILEKITSPGSNYIMIDAKIADTDDITNGMII